MRELQQLVKDIEETPLYKRNQINVPMFIEFIKRFLNKDTRDKAVNKWIEFAGYDSELNMNQSGMFKEVELVNEKMEVIAIIPPLYSNRLPTSVEPKFDDMITETTKKISTYGDAGATEFNFNMMNMSKAMINKRYDTWSEVIRDILLSENSEPQEEEPQETDEENDTYYE
jgi:hypothetical protein